LYLIFFRKVVLYYYTCSEAEVAMSRYKTITVISKKDEEILRLNRRVLDESPDLIAVIGTDFHFNYVNPAYVNIHGLTADDFIGRHVREFLGVETFDGIVKPNLERCMKGEDVRYEEWFDFPKTGVLYMDVRYLPLKDSDGRIDRIVVLLRDITHMKKSENARIDREKLQTVVQLAGTYNHEINNPLCSLGGYLELLKRNEEDPHKLSFIDKAMSEVARITGVTQNFADATSIEFIDYPGGGKIVGITTENNENDTTECEDTNE